MADWPAVGAFGVEWNMLFLAGLFGLMAVGGFAFAGDFSGEDDMIAVGDDGDAGDTPVGPEVPDPSTDTGSSGLILSGEDLDDTITGGAGDDQINGYAGDDSIQGGDGRDDLYGAEGDDILHGDADADILHGQDGDDTLSGDAGDDQLFGHSDNDLLTGGDGNDDLYGGLGDDTLNGDAGDDALLGGDGDDHLDGGAGQDTLFGGWGNDVVSGIETGPADPATAPGASSDFLNGGGGDDTILTGEGDIVTAGDGEDTIVLGDWIADGEAAEVMDFDASQDQLVMVCDMTQDIDPVVEVTTDPDSPDVSHILIDGAEIAQVHSSEAVTVQDIVLVDHADAASFGLRAWP